MAQGIQVFGPDGALWVDVGSRLARHFGLVTIGPGSGSVDLPQLNGQGTPFAIITNPRDDSGSYGSFSFTAPITGAITFSGGIPTLNMNFTFASYVNPYADLYYGAY